VKPQGGVLKRAIKSRCKSGAICKGEKRRGYLLAGQVTERRRGSFGVREKQGKVTGGRSFPRKGGCEGSETDGSIPGKGIIQRGKRERKLTSSETRGSKGDSPQVSYQGRTSEGRARDFMRREKGVWEGKKRKFGSKTSGACSLTNRETRCLIHGGGGGTKGRENLQAW